MLNRLRIDRALLAGALISLSVAGWAMPQQHGEAVDAPAPGSALKSAAVRLSDVSDLAGILPELLDKRVVFVGEMHDRYEHHLNQLAVIEGIHQRHPRLAIGLEFFQWPFQPVLDQFVAGEIDEKQMLRETEYFSRWRFDYALYKPILDYARENNIALIALNVPRELTEKVAEGGMAVLTDEERQGLPADIDRDDAKYRERVEAVYKMHPQRPESNFEHFLDAQLLWDEGMAERAANYLGEHPDHKLVILAGTGHVIEGTGIPNRLARRMDVPSAIVINGGEMGIDPAMGDYLLLPTPQSPPARGLLGLYLDTLDEGLFVSRIDEGSAAGEAGVKSGDQILSIDGEALKSYADLRIAMLGRVAGDGVTLRVKRKHWWHGMEEKRFEVTLR